MGSVYKTALIIVDIINLLLLVRAVCSWIPELRYGKIHGFAYRLTEPMLAPIRRFLLKFDIFRQIPFDMSFIALYYLLKFFLKILARVIYFLSI